MLIILSTTILFKFIGTLLILIGFTNKSTNNLLSEFKVRTYLLLIVLQEISFIRLANYNSILGIITT